MGSTRIGHEWTADETKNGIRLVNCESWTGFVDFINNILLDYRHYVFRGHASEAWKLESTLDRIIRESGRADSKKLRENHLQSFIYAARGRRGATPKPLTDENECWAIGQHHGLATPLLDWTESPYVGAYFAFCAPDKAEAVSDNRVVYALQRVTVERKVKELTSSEDKITFIKPLLDDNPRLINQRGLFTRAPNNVPIEKWIAKHFRGISDGAKLIRITIPTSERSKAMKSLNRMNINHLSLFPDLYGAAIYCNHELMLDKY